MVIVAQPLLLDKGKRRIKVNVVNFQYYQNSNTRHNTDLLSVLPSERLFQYFEIYRKTIFSNQNNIDYVLWGEALLEEISQRKLTKEFEEALCDSPNISLIQKN
jgi:hypothetical protein